MSKILKKYAALCLLSLLVVSGLACVWSTAAPVAAGDATPVPSLKSIGGFYPIEGTDYQLAAIETDYGTGSSGFNPAELFRYGNSNYSVHNYVFFDVKEETVYPLLLTNNDVILSMSGFPTPKPTATPDEPKAPVKWWLYTLVKADTNADKELSYKDLQTLGLSDVSGRGYTELLTGVDRVLTTTYKAGDILLVIYHAEGKYNLAHIDLRAQAITQTTELPSFGEDVK